jgi:hypothetical protein
VIDRELKTSDGAPVVFGSVNVRLGSLQVR